MNTNVRLVDETYVSLAQLEERLGVSRATIRRAMDRAGIRPVLLGGARNSSLRYVASEVEAWLRASKA